MLFDKNDDITNERILYTGNGLRGTFVFPCFISDQVKPGSVPVPASGMHYFQRPDGPAWCLHRCAEPACKYSA